jgi:hypothetical protein
MTAAVLVAAVVVSDPTPGCLSFPPIWLLIQTPPNKFRNVLGTVVSDRWFGNGRFGYCILARFTHTSY